MKKTNENNPPAKFNEMMNSESHLELKKKIYIHLHPHTHTHFTIIKKRI